MDVKFRNRVTKYGDLPQRGKSVSALVGLPQRGKSVSALVGLPQRGKSDFALIGIARIAKPSAEWHRSGNARLSALISKLTNLALIIAFFMLINARYAVNRC
jgi:hypothetical protein